MQRTQTKIVIKESTGRRIVEQSRLRMFCTGFFFVLCFMSIGFRAIEIAVIQNPKALTVTVFNPDNEEESEQVEIRVEDNPLQRGNIVDRNGILLATSLTTASVFINAEEIMNSREVASKLSKVLSIDKKTLLQRLNSKKSFVWIKRNLTPKEQYEVNRLGIPGVYFKSEEKRVYPYGNAMSHVIGYVGVDNKGLAGIEQQFDGRLREPSVNSEPLELSVDVRLQSMLRDEMSKTVEEFNAIGAVGVILDIPSGEVLSMVSLPDFDPNKISNKDTKARFNKASLGTYEMGSTFKSFTMAMGLDYGVVNMKSGYDATNPFKVSTFTISDSHGKKRFLTVPEIYAYSSNIGTAKMALDVGGKRQREFLKKIGLLEPVKVEIPARASPQFPEDWKEINTVTISYGHGISVTPLHLVQAIATLVDSGTKKDITLLKNGNKNKKNAERVISENTSKNIRRLMRLVVEYGTGSKADVAGYRVGGKTGTAEKIQSSGGYNPDAKLTSFISVFPVDKPKYAVLVMIDEPKGNKSTYGYATGGMIAAPTAGRVIARMGAMLGIKPRFDVPEDDAEKFWVSNEKNESPRRQPAYFSPLMEKRYVSEISY